MKNPILVAWEKSLERDANNETFWHAFAGVAALVALALVLIWIVGNTEPHNQRPELFKTTITGQEAQR